MRCCWFPRASAGPLRCWARRQGGDQFQRAGAVRWVYRATTVARACWREGGRRVRDRAQLARPKAAAGTGTGTCAAAAAAASLLPFAPLRPTSSHRHDVRAGSRSNGLCCDEQSASPLARPSERCAPPAAASPPHFSLFLALTGTGAWPGRGKQGGNRRGRRAAPVSEPADRPEIPDAGPPMRSRRPWRWRTRASGARRVRCMFVRACTHARTTPPASEAPCKASPPHLRIGTVVADTT